MARALLMAHQHVPELRSLTAIALGAGAQDRPIAGETRALSAVLTRYGIDHTLDIYSPGDHVDRVGERVEEDVLPFFSEHLGVP